MTTATKFQKFGQPKYTRYGEDLAFATARFIAKGGTYIGYYMWHGGTNFGKWVIGKPRHLHYTVSKYKHLILTNDPTEIQLNTKHAEAHIYGDLSTRALVFFTNEDASSDITITFEGRKLTLVHWSVTIYPKDSAGLHKLYSTARPKPTLLTLDASALPPRSSTQSLLQTIKSLEPPYFQTPELKSYLQQPQHLSSLETTRSIPSKTELTQFPHASNNSHIYEPIGIDDNATIIMSQTPLEQIRATVDSSDYMWYVSQVLVKESKDKKKFVVHLECLETLDMWLSANEQKRPARPVDLEVPADKKKKKRKGDGKKSKKPEPSPKKPAEPPVDGGDKEVAHDLQILVSVAGIWNYGAVYENVRKGLLGAVRVDKVDVTKGAWIHQIGLKGEVLKYALGSLARNSWESSFTPTAETREVPLTWYLIKFSKRQLLELHDRAVQTQVVAQTYNVNSNMQAAAIPISAFVLNLASMSRGLAFVNGNAVGRYWNLL
ncbi:UNVERIFIED_CONTAM: hypothetical protein HDU68_004927 [Siphonaria sp. JEL0065]|nr:hypothetical protein HDU68_004927 [Siphonaria sp. JEL0065]